MTIGIIGLGLMGGSLGIALKERDCSCHLIGYDHNEKHCEEALALGLVDMISPSLDRIIACDVIFLSIPVDGIIAALKSLTSVDKNCTIIDLGSTKSKIVDSIPKEIRSNFVAAHPMTGTEKFGPTAAIRDLYRDKVVVLCDLEDSGSIQKKRALKIFEEIGM